MLSTAGSNTATSKTETQSLIDGIFGTANTALTGLFTYKTAKVTGKVLGGAGTAKTAVLIGGIGVVVVLVFLIKRK